MGILRIRPAVHGGSKAIINIAGATGSGKTYTALLIARGMVSKGSEIGFLDTENGRGSFYADILGEPFMIADLYPPFSPSRYSMAIKEFQEAGIKVLVIDSVTHEWEGEGGCDDIAHAKVGKMDNWIGAKQEHKKFMNTLLQSDMHIICCIRAREKTDFKNPSKPVSLGIQPVCEKNFMFEATASFLVEDEGKTQRPIKIPAFLKKTFGNGTGYLGVETGKSIMNWINSGEKEDPEVTKCRSIMLQTSEKGIKALLEEWGKLSPEMQEKMKPHMAVYKESAKAYDFQNQNEVDLLQQLVGLIESKGEAINAELKADLERIVSNKEEASYQKAIDTIKSL